MKNSILNNKYIKLFTPILYLVANFILVLGLNSLSGIGLGDFWWFLMFLFIMVTPTILIIWQVYNIYNIKK